MQLDDAIEVGFHTYMKKIGKNKAYNPKLTKAFRPTGDIKTHNRACKLFNIRLYATLCFNYFR